jgi:RNA polymerase sigma-70 factor, ECF subfamily
MDLLDFFLRSREAQSALAQARARLYRVAYAWCHHPALADDLVQETLTKALRKSALHHPCQLLPGSFPQAA